MIIGSLHISKENYIYQITNFTKCREHPLFANMIDLFPIKPTYTIPSDQIYSLDSVVSLAEFIQNKPFTIQNATKLLYSIYYQVQCLLENNIAISFINLDDIMVIDNIHYYFCNCDKLYTIKKNNRIVITDFYDKTNPFLPPEFQTNTIMPFSTFPTSVYYSLAINILYCLQGTNITKPGTEQITHFTSDVSLNKSYNIDYNGILQKYCHTKLYHTLSICLIEDPKKRNPILF